MKFDGHQEDVHTPVQGSLGASSSCCMKGRICFHAQQRNSQQALFLQWTNYATFGLKPLLLSDTSKMLFETTFFTVTRISLGILHQHYGNVRGCITFAVIVLFYQVKQLCVTLDRVVEHWGKEWPLVCSNFAFLSNRQAIVSSLPQNYLDEVNLEGGGRIIMSLSPRVGSFGGEYVLIGRAWLSKSV